MQTLAETRLNVEVDLELRRERDNLLIERYAATGMEPAELTRLGRLLARACKKPSEQCQEGL